MRLTNRTDGFSEQNGYEKGASSNLSFSKLAWSSLLSLVVLIVIGYYTFDLDQFSQFIAQLNPWILTAAIGTVVLRVLFGGWRLRYVSNGRLNFSSSIRGQLAWDFFSNVTPSAIGGGPFAAFYIAGDRRIPVGEATIIMLFSMLLDQLWFAVLIPALLVASLFIPVFPEALGSVGMAAFVLLFLGMLTWVVGFGYAILFRPELFHKFADLIFRMRWLRRFRHRVGREMGQLQYRAKILRQQPPRFFLYGFLLTAGVWLSRFLLPVLIIWSVYPEVDQVLAFFRTLMMTVGSMVLPTPGGSGGIEGLYVLFLGPPLIPKAITAPTLLTWRLLGYYLFLALGVYLSMHQVQKQIRRKRTDARLAKQLVTETSPALDGEEIKEVLQERL
jgi:uncharacterized protein (TIRG00374 family)